MNAAESIKEIERRHWVTEQEVRSNIEEIITGCMSDPDPSVQAVWATCPREGERPTPEGFIDWVVQLVKERRAH